jgi:hypothetical protein
MKRIISTFFVATIAIAFNAEAAVINGLLGSYDTEFVDPDVYDQSGVVGDLNIDPILAYTSLGNSGDATEMDWMTAALDYIGDPYDTIWTLEKIEFEGSADTDDYWNPLGGNIYTGDLEFGTSHFLIKIGQGNVEYDTFLYQNLDSILQATISLGWLDEFSGLTSGDFDIYRVSHLSQVPIPATAWLFGTALIGLVGFSKRRKAA